LFTEVRSYIKHIQLYCVVFQPGNLGNSRFLEFDLIHPKKIKLVKIEFMKTLYYGDNLEILITKIADEIIDLCYIDPPFNRGRPAEIKERL